MRPMIATTLLTRSEGETHAAGERLAELLFKRPRVFVQLSGPLGAGKTAFARGFVRRWSRLAGDALPDPIISPSYNIVRIYGVKRPVCHLDLYRVKAMQELEQLGFEQYFYEMPCCLVEWLEQVPEAAALRPSGALCVRIAAGEYDGERTIRIEDPSGSSPGP